MPAYSQLILPRRRYRSRFFRTLRAVWRDSSALLTEFRRPVLVFLTALLLGGYLYGELLVHAGYARQPYHNLPYLMLSLMVLNPTTEVPPEPYLIAFWYVMPALAVYIVGHGVADFVRLFFNRDERRDAWEEALASTYRNHIIILGVGHLGMRVIIKLVEMGFDVVAIDNEITPEKSARLKELGVPTILADGRQATTLDNAGLRYAQSLIVCTSNELVNLEAVMRARDLNPDVRIVARSWDNQFAQQLKTFMNVSAVLSASDLSAPVFAGLGVGIEITQTLKIHNVEYSVIRMNVETGSFLDGETIDQLQTRYTMDIVMHGRGDEVAVHPEDDIVVHGGDMLVIFARHDKIIDLVARNRGDNRKKRA